MPNIDTTKVYKVNGRLVVANDIVEAIDIYREYYASTDSYNRTPEIESVSLIKDGQLISSSALIRKS